MDHLLRVVERMAENRNLWGELEFNNQLWLFTHANCASDSGPATRHENI